MIVIDKVLPTQTIIVTASESSIQDDLRLKVYSTYSYKTFYLPLGPNLSPHPSRYDEYAIASADVAEWDSGFYQYELQDYNGEVINKVLEVGLLKLKGESTPVYVSIPQSEPEDDYLIYD